MFHQIDERALLIDWMKQYGAPREWVAQYSYILSQPPIWGESPSPYEKLQYDQGWFYPYSGSTPEELWGGGTEPVAIPKASEAGFSPLILALLGGTLIYWIYQRKRR